MVGEHWLVSHFKGTIFGAEFHGASQTTYDADKKKFLGTWVDSMSPHSMKTEGTWDEKTQTLTTVGIGKDPTGAETKTKMVIVYGKENSRVFNMYQTINGAEVKMMEIKYTKASDKIAK